MSNRRRLSEEPAPVTPPAPLAVINCTNIAARVVAADVGITELSLRNAAFTAVIPLDRENLEQVAATLAKIAADLRAGADGAGLVTPPSAGKLFVPGQD